MMTADELNKRWKAALARPIASEMSFDGDFLVLGAQTRLAKVGAGLDRPRLVALLAAAHRRPIAASWLKHVERALQKRRDGDPVLALIHLALSGVAKLRNPREDARRLFMADELMAEGLDPLVIVEGLGLDPASFDEALEKYSHDQPRVPAGNTDGGQWTSGDSAGTTDSPTSSLSPSRHSSPPIAGATEAPQSQNGASAQESQHNDLPIVDAAYQGEYHDFLRDQFAQILRRAGNTVVTEVPFTMPAAPPITAEIDILFRAVDGVVYGIEVKTGDDPSFTPAQQIVYPHVEAGGIVVSPDPRVAALALTPGVALDRIEIVVMKTAGPGAPIHFVPILKYMRE